MSWTAEGLKILRVHILIQGILKEQVLLLYLAKSGVWCVWGEGRAPHAFSVPPPLNAHKAFQLEPFKLLLSGRRALPICNEFDL